MKITEEMITAAAKQDCCPDVDCAPAADYCAVRCDRDRIRRILEAALNHNSAAAADKNKRVERPRAALELYGDHLYECELKNGGACSCGYEVALAQPDWDKLRKQTLKRFAKALKYLADH